MNLQLSGGTVSVSAPLLEQQLHAALKTVLRTVNGHFQGIDTSIQQVRKGYGVAAALADLASAQPDPLRRVLHESAAATKSVEDQVKQAHSIIARADKHCALLRSLSHHIKFGSDILYESADPVLAESARVMRKAFLLGDRDGTAKQVADVLLTESDTAAQAIVNAADYARKLTAAIKAATFKQQSLLLEQLHAAAQRPLAVVDERQRMTIKHKAAALASAAEAYRGAYGRTFLKAEATRRPPRLHCVAKDKLVRTAKGFNVVREAI